MAWIEVHQSLFTHRKTLELADLLGIPTIHAAAHVIALWAWSLDNAPDGALHVRTTIIARASEWRGDANALVDALIESGFLDHDDTGDLQIHDWDDYAGRLVDKRRANAQRMREAREKQRVSNKEESATHVQRTLRARAGATVPNSTVPNSTKESVARATEPPGAEDNFTVWFNEVCDLYPKKTLKQAAMKVARRIAVRDWDAVISSVKHYAQSTKVVEGFIKDLPGYLKDGFWKDYVDGPIIERRGNGQSRRDEQLEDAARGAFGAGLDEVFGGATGRTSTNNQTGNVRQLPGRRQAG